MKKFKIGILGASSIATRKFIPAIKKTSNIKIDFIASRNLSKAKKLSKIYKCKYGNYNDLFNNSKNLDIVYISTPPNKRLHYFKKSIEKKLNIFSEKPAFIDYSSAKKIISLCNKNKVFFFECWMFKYHPQHDAVKQLIKSNTIGKINFFESKFFYPEPASSNIRLNKNLKGGVLYDSIGYPINALDILFGLRNFSNNFYFINHKKYKVDKLVNIQLKSKEIIANLSCGFGFNYESYYKIYGSKGIIKVDKPFSINENFSNKIKVYKDDKIKYIKIKSYNQFSLMISNFLNIMNEHRFVNKNNNFNLKYIKLFTKIFKI